MYILNIIKNNFQEEFVLKDEPDTNTIEELVQEHFVTLKDAEEFYTNREQYMKEIQYSIQEHGYPTIWEFQTNQTGWDTYDSGVFIAWTEKRARKIAEEISSDFYRAHVECIGISNRVIEGYVCTSFNAG